MLENPADSAETTGSEARPVPWKIIILGIVALVLAVVIATQVLGVLYVILFPPQPPLPADVSLVRHTNTDYGVDEWLYNSSQSACTVMKFYVEKNGQCRIAPLQCEGDNPTYDKTLPGVSAFSQNVARCTGETKVSIFAMRWEVDIATGPSPDVPTQFSLTREVFWTGQVPHSNPTSSEQP